MYTNIQEKYPLITLVICLVFLDLAPLLCYKPVHEKKSFVLCVFIITKQTVPSPEFRLHYIQWTPEGCLVYHISEAKVSGVTFILTPYGHPLLLLERIKHDAFICKVARLLTDPHGVVLRNAVIILGTFEKSTLMDRMQRKRQV